MYECYAHRTKMGKKGLHSALGSLFQLDATPDVLEQLGTQLIIWLPLRRFSAEMLVTGILEAAYIGCLSLRDRKSLQQLTSLLHDLGGSFSLSLVRSENQVRKQMSKQASHMDHKQQLAMQMSLSEILLNSTLFDIQ